jgi:uncharacterized protein
VNRFLTIARSGKNSFWRYIMTESAVLFFFMVGMAPFLTILVQHPGTDSAITPTLLGVSSATFLALNLIPYIFAAVGLYIAIRYFHHRNFRTLITPNARVNWRKIIYGAAVWTGLMLILDGVAFAFYPQNYVFHFDGGQFFLTLVVCAILIPIQASVEELMFRGYLMQCIGLTAKRVFIPLLTTTLIFAALHSPNPEVQTYGMIPMMISYCTIGLLLGIVTIMDEGLELAMGIHSANNLYSVLFVAFPSSVLPAPALFTVQTLNVSLANLSLLASAAIALVIFARKYQWGNFNKLTARLDWQSKAEHSIESLTEAPTKPTSSTAS